MNRAVDKVEIAEMMTAPDLRKQLLAALTVMTEIQNEQSKANKELARATYTYRQAQAKAFLDVIAANEKKPTDPHIKAIVDKTCAPEMWAIRLAEANANTIAERMRTIRAEVSALQSLIGAYRAEAEIERMTGKYVT